MYLATKDGSSCRIPEKKTGKKESATQEDVNPANS